MSVDHGPVPVLQGIEPIFLSVKAAMKVIVGSENFDDCWMADMIHDDGGARDPEVSMLFQVADVDNGTIDGSARMW